MLHEKINEDIQIKGIEYAGLKRELDGVNYEYTEKAKLQGWLESKDREYTNKVIGNSLETEISTINLMKIKINDSDKPKISDYVEDYKSTVKIYETLRPETFILNVTCLMNEILRQVAYKLWKVLIGIVIL
jgi:hypothetical protein